MPKKENGLVPSSNLNRIKLLMVVLVVCMAMAPSPALAERQNIKAILETASATAEMGDYEGAIRILDEALRTGKNRRILMTAQANTFLLQKKYDEAEHLCLKVLKEDPKYDWPLLVLTKVYFSKEDFAKTKQRIDELKSFVKNKDILYELTIMEAEILRAKKEYRGAEEATQRAIQLKKDLLPGYELRSLNFRLLGKIKESEGELLKALPFASNDPRLLEILADHYRDRRQYQKMWAYLNQAVKACNGDLANCGRFQDAYHDDYFINSGISGYDLSSRGVPLSFYFENEYSAEFSNIENMLRSLKNELADRGNENKLPPAKATPKNVTRFYGNLFVPNFPVIHLNALYDQKFNEKDPLVEHRIQDYRAETEKTVHLPLFGDTTFFPYFKYTFLRGANFSVTDIFAGKFELNQYIFALRSISSPSFGRWYIEPEYAFGLGDFRHSKRLFTEHRGSVRVGRVFEDQSRIAVRSQYYYASHNTRNDDLRLVQDLLIEKFLFQKQLMVWTEQALIFHQDFLFHNSDLTTLIYRPVVGVKFRPTEPLNFQMSVGHFLGDSFPEYDHLLFDAQAAYQFNMHFHKHVAGQKLPYRMPFEIILGYKSEYFYHFPRHKNKWLDALYVLVKFAR